MDQAKNLNQYEEVGRQSVRKFNSSIGRCLIPVKWKPERGSMTTVDGRGDGQGDVRDNVEAHEPRVVELNLKASLMGVKIYGDKGQFFSRQSSMSTSNRFSTKIRSVVTTPCCSAGVQGRPSVDRVEKKHRGISIVAASTTPCVDKKVQNGTHRHMATSSPKRSEAVSGVLYSSPQIGNNANSSILNAVHFTFGDASVDACGHVTEKIYKQLLEQSRASEDCIDHGELEIIPRTQSSSGTISAKWEKYSDAVSTLTCETESYPRVSCSSSLTFSERLFGYEFARYSPPRPSRLDAESAPSTNMEPNAQLNSHRGQHSTPATALSDYDDTDEDDIILEDDIIFEVPNGIALQCSHDQPHYAELVLVGAKAARPKCERWSSNTQSFNLELEKQQPVKTPLARPGNRNRQQQSTDPAKSANARAKLDVSHRDITCMSSLDSSFNGGSRRLKGRTLSFGSDRSGLLDFESDMDDFVLDSGRLKIDMKYEPDFENPDFLIPNLEHLDNGANRFQDVRAKMDEQDFPFNSPIASTFVFGDGLRKCSDDAQQQILNSSLSSIPGTDAVETDFDNDELDHSDAYHDPDGGSVSDTDSSLTTFSLDADSTALLDQPSHWVSTRSFNYLREVVDHNSGFLNIGSRSGRFSVDLQQEKRLGRVDLPPRPGTMRLSIRKTEKSSSRRSLLSPCLVWQPNLEHPSGTLHMGHNITFDMSDFWDSLADTLSHVKLFSTYI